MNLTRNVIIEKSYPFGRYSHPEDIPECLWDYADLIINGTDVKVKEAILLYLEIVFVPLSTIKDFTITRKSQYNGNYLQGFYQIDCADIKFNVEFSSTSSYINIKKITFTIWAWYEQEIELYKSLKK